MVVVTQKSQIIFDIKILPIMIKCENALDCFFGSSELRGKYEECFFREKEKGCDLVRLRKEIEQESPAFFGKLREYSEYDSVVKNLMSTEFWGSEYQKNIERIRWEKLKGFLTVSLFVTFSFAYLEDVSGGESEWELKIPYISSEFIKDILEKKDILIPTNRTKLEGELSQVDLVSFRSGTFFSQEKWYQEMLYIVLKCIGSDYGKKENLDYLRQLWRIIQIIFEATKMDKLELSIDDKEELFSDVNRYLVSQRGK